METVWIGLNDLVTAETYVRSDDPSEQPPGFLFWKPDEPNRENERCIGMDYNNQYSKWADILCARRKPIDLS